MCQLYLSVVCCRITIFRHHTLGYTLTSGGATPSRINNASSVLPCKVVSQGINGDAPLSKLVFILCCFIQPPQPFWFIDTPILQKLYFFRSRLSCGNHWNFRVKYLFFELKSSSSTHGFLLQSLLRSRVPSPHYFRCKSLKTRGLGFFCGLSVQLDIFTE